MDTQSKPFNDKKVREAVNYAVDSRAPQRIYGGLLTPGCNFLRRGARGLREDRSLPVGRPATRRRTSRRHGRWSRTPGADGTELTVYGNDEQPTRRITEYYADTLNKIGFKAKPEIVESSVYFDTIGSEKTGAKTGFANWFPDYPHPYTYLFLNEGKTIQPTRNQNYSRGQGPADRQDPRGGAEGARPGEGQGQVGGGGQADRRAGVRRALRAAQADARSSRSGSTARTAPATTRSTTTTTRPSASSSGVRDGGRGTEVTLDAPAALAAEEGRGSTAGGRAVAAGAAAAAPQQGRARVRPAVRRDRRGPASPPRCGPSRWPRPARTRTTSPTRSRSTASRRTWCRVDGIPIGPTWHGKFFLGADRNGRDTMVRLLYGGRNSLLIGIIGGAHHRAAGGARRPARRLLRRDRRRHCLARARHHLGVPGDPARVSRWAWRSPSAGSRSARSTIAGDSLWIPTLIIAFVYVPYMARPVRGQGLSLRRRSSSRRPARRARGRCGSCSRSCCPNLSSTIVVFVPLLVANAILLEAALSFLGAGVQEPEAVVGDDDRRRGRPAHHRARIWRSSRA